MLLKEMDLIPKQHTLVTEREVAPGIFVETKIKLNSDKTWNWV